ncbi:uncharacterized protein [Haliotis asinina]|uniref:uncharacterized protein n=1 Tax=Haliotis asinina TaxID=109174 RepID=UPI003531F516
MAALPTIYKMWIWKTSRQRQEVDTISFFFLIENRIQVFSITEQLQVLQTADTVYMDDGIFTPFAEQAIVSTLARRAKAICDPAHLQDETDHLKRTFIALNGYPKQLVDQTIATTFQHQNDRLPKPEPAPIRVNIPYQGKIGHQISRLLRKTASVDVTFYSDRTLKNILSANGRGGSDQTNPNPRGCIYKINCDCGSSYIGETCRPFNVRLKEHKTSVRNLDLKSALSEHIVNYPNHSINWKNTEFLASNISDWWRRKLWEAINIRRLEPQINRDQGVYLPSAWCVNKDS